MTQYQYSTIHRRQDPTTARITPTTLVVAIDMAKYNPKALICDYQGTILEAPFGFGPHQHGVHRVMGGGLARPDRGDPHHRGHRTHGPLS